MAIRIRITTGTLSNTTDTYAGIEADSFDEFIQALNDNDETWEADPSFLVSVNGIFYGILKKKDSGGVI